MDGIPLVPPATLASLLVGGLVAGGLVLIAPALFIVAIYNNLRRLEVRARNAFSQIDVQLKRRFDLVPNLVESVKGAMAHERSTLEAVIAARSRAAGALGAVHQGAMGGAMGVAAMGALANAAGALDGAVGRLIGLVERYPELQANENALALQQELASTENRIAFARQAYNDAVMRLNESIVVFPSSLVARWFRIGEMGLFEASAGEREAVAVRF
jgi:LemA protein